MHVLRGIASISRWDGTTKVNRPDATIAGDVIADLRTSENTLSVWLADTEEDIQDAVVALALTRDKVSKLTALLLDDETLTDMRIELSGDAKGQAPGASETITSKHRDMLEIDYKRLGSLADYMMGLAKNDSKRKEYTKSQVKTLLEQYRTQGKISPANMKKQLLVDLNWQL